MRYFLLIAAFLAESAVAQTPLFRLVGGGPRSVARYGLFELTVEMSAKAVNPYDYDERALRCVFAGPGGVRDTVDGFYMQDYSLDTATGLLNLRGGGVYKVRYAPRVTGRWSYTLFCTGGAAASAPGARGVGASATGALAATVSAAGAAASAAATGSFICEPSASPGFVRRNPSPYLSFDNGSAFIPIGENMGWAHGNTYLDYRRWVGRLADNKGNFIRVWMPSWGLGLEWKKGLNGYEGLMRYNQRNAWYLDWLVGCCAGKGVYMMLSLDHHGQVSTKTDPNWNENPYNSVNGGPCPNTWDFFTSDSARHLIRNRFRYIVARYGYSRTIMSWELFNEVDWTDDFDRRKGDVSTWHAEMAAWLSHADVNHHLITTSFGRAENDPGCWKIPALDFTQSHYYSETPALDSLLVSGARSYRRVYHKATLNGEFGLNGNGSTLAVTDPTGIYVHNCLWATLFGGAMGPALPWYWDDYIEPQGLYTHFLALSAFAGGINFIGDGYAPVEDVEGDAASDGSPGIRAAGSGIAAPDAGGQQSAGAARQHAVGQAATGALRCYLLRSADSTKLAGYVLNRRYNWREVKEKGLPPAVKQAVLEVAMRTGSYIVSWADCRTGAVVSESRVKVNDGILRVSCPAVEWDMAVKIVRAGAR